MSHVRARDTPQQRSHFIPGNIRRGHGVAYTWTMLAHTKERCYLIIVDAFTKWLEVHVMNSSTAEAIVEKLRTTFLTFGIPETVVSDNGTCFVSEVFQTFKSRNGIRHIKVAPKHPASNGLAEPSVQCVKEGLNKMTTGSLETKLARFLFKYRNTPHSTTGKSPTELLFGRKVRTHLDHLHTDRGESCRRTATKAKVVPRPTCEKRTSQCL